MDDKHKPTLIPIALRLGSEEYEHAIQELIVSAKMTLTYLESNYWEPSYLRPFIHRNLHREEVRFCVERGGAFLKPESLEFFHALFFAASFGRPIRVICKWA